MSNGEAPDMARVEQKLDRIIGLLALMAVPSDATQQEKAVHLNRAGLAPREIATLLGADPHTVAVQLSTARHKKRQRTGGRPKRSTK